MSGPAPPPALRVLQASRRWMAWLALPVLGLLAVLTSLQYRQGVAEAERELVHQARRRAQDVLQRVQPAIDHVHDLRALMQMQWQVPPDAGSGLGQALRPHRAAGQPDGWALDDAAPALRQRWGQVWWAEPDGRPPPPAWLHRAAAFVTQAQVAHQRQPGFEASWFAGTDTNTAFGYPWLPIASITQAMGVPSLAAIAGPRQDATAATLRWMAQHPGQTSFWSPPAVSQLHQQRVVSHGALVLIDGAYRGEVSVDFRLDALQALASDWAAEQDRLVGPGSRLWLLDERGELLADSAQPLQPLAAATAVLDKPGGKPGPHPGDTPGDTLARRLPAGLPASLTERALRQPGVLLHGAGWLLVASRDAGAPWAVLMALPAAQLQARVWQGLLPNALLAAALLLMFGAAQWLLACQFIQPAVLALAYGRALARDPQTPAPQLGRRWQAWVDASTEIFATQRAALQREMQQRRQREAFNAAIVDHAPAAIITVDAEDRIVEFNPAAERLFGHRRTALLGQAAGRRLFSAGLQTSAGLPTLLGAGNATPAVPLLAVHAQGHRFPVQGLGWQTEIDGAPHFSAWLVDLTEPLRAREQIERQREALRQSEKLSALGSLLAGVAHELNNPLSIVMGRAAMLEERHPQASVQADARRIREAADRCGRIVHTFLHMARARPARRGPVALNDLVRGAAELLAYNWRSHGIALRLQLVDGLPAAWADSDQIGQVVLNLMVNAQQALASAGRPGRVQVSSGSDGLPGQPATRVWLRVADNGPGVSAAAQDRLFEPFFTTRSDGLGTGLGLALSRSQVREHGGDLWLEPAAPGGGASFCLYLPLARDGADAAQPALPDQPAKPSPPSTAGAGPRQPSPGSPPPARILVVDDEPAVARLMRDMLEGDGHEVAVADSGADALEMLGLARFDAVVTDLRMPEADGAALWRHLRQHHPALATRLLFVTGDTLSPASHQFLADSGCPGLDKPFSQADLRAAVARLLAVR